MTPKEREAEEATRLFHQALVALGLKSIEDSQGLWQDVPPIPDVADSPSAAKWLSAATAYVMHRRLRAQALALAYYRYQRALFTGETIAWPGRESETETTLGVLKREFEDQLNPRTGEVDEPPEGSRGGLVVDNERVGVVVIEGLAEDLEDLEGDTEGRVVSSLHFTGPRSQDRNVKAANPKDVAAADTARRTAHTTAGRRQASASERHVLNGARGALFLLTNGDEGALGFVRISTTGSPCNFCSMLMSREIAYRSSASGSSTEDGDRFHDNCRCVAVPVFSAIHYQGSPLFEANRRYGKAWRELAKANDGERPMVEVWAEYMDRERTNRSVTRKTREAV